MSSDSEQFFRLIQNFSIHESFWTTQQKDKLMGHLVWNGLYWMCCLFYLLGQLRISHLFCIYKVQAWNSRWCRSYGSNSIWHGAADWFSPVSVANELAAAFQILGSVCCSSSSVIQPSPLTFPSSTCIDLIWGDWYMLYMGVISYYMCSSSISYMLTAPCCGFIGRRRSSSVADLPHQDQTH